MKQLSCKMKRNSLLLLLFLLGFPFLLRAQNQCSPVGWATQNGGTTGGGSATPVTVTSISEFQDVAASDGAKVIYVKGTMGAGVDTRVEVSSDKTIFGLPGAKLVGGIDVKDADNVIIRNLTIQGPGAIDVDGVDCMTIQNSTHVWIDHMDIYDGQDGNLDIVNGSNYVTLTWCKFHYTSASKEHQFSNLLGNSDSKTSDRGKIKVTLQYNWWADGVKERMPRVRFGQVHVVNNLFNSNASSTCVRAGKEADLLVESNVFSGVDDPIDLYKGDYTAVTVRNNIFNNTSGSKTGDGTAFTPPYALTISPASQVESMVTASAGATLTSMDCDGGQSNQAPTVAITSPSNNSSFNAPVGITINANALDSDGSVSQVAFYNGSILLGTDHSSPYSYSWNNVTAGNYMLTAKATDNEGTVTTSSSVSVTVNANANANQTPIVAITSPVNNASFNAPVSITINANASDPDGSVSQVAFYNGSTLLGTDNSSPYSYSWNNVTAGNYTLTAKATDNEGTEASASVNVIVSSVNTDCDAPVKYGIVGYATLAGGTKGGQGGTTVTVSNGTDLQNAIKNKGTQPLIIYINGTITPANSPGLSKIDIKDVSDISIIGVGTSGEFDGIGLKVWRASNIIIQNVKVHNVLTGDKDCISIEGPSDHVWVDHCELYNQYQGVDKDYYDGLLDSKGESEYITYSWNYLHDSWKASLCGSSETDTYDRKITYHHNLFENINSRLPLYRGGHGHIFNNYYKNIGSTGINSRLGACLKIENNYFENTKDPYVTAYSDVDGYGDISGNILVNSPFAYTSDERELQSCTASIPYSYATFLNTAQVVPEIVEQFSGVGKLDLTTDCPELKNILSIAVNGNGTVAKNPDETSYTSGTSVTLTATPSSGWQFIGWSGDVTGNQNPSTIAIDSNMSVTANFSLINTNISIIQAESACSYNGVLENTNAGFNGTAYVNTDNATGAKITWSLNVPSAGSYSVGFRYANSGTSGRAVQVLVNNAEVNPSLEFPVTGDWTSWDTKYQALNLIAGDNLIEFIALTADGTANIDEISVDTKSVIVGGCFVTNTVEAYENSISAYPNPFEKEMTISADGHYTYSFTDMKGVVLEEGEGQYTEVAGAHLAAGMYVLKVETSAGIQIIKVNKK